MTRFVIEIQIVGDTPQDAYRNLRDLLDHDGRVRGYHAETFRDKNGETRNTAELFQEGGES